MILDANAWRWATIPSARSLMIPVGLAAADGPPPHRPGDGLLPARGLLPRSPRRQRGIGQVSGAPPRQPGALRHPQPCLRRLGARPAPVPGGMGYARGAALLTASRFSVGWPRVFGTGAVGGCSGDVPADLTAPGGPPAAALDGHHPGALLGRARALARSCPQAEIQVLEASGLEQSPFVREVDLAGVRVCFEFSRMAAVLQATIPRLM